MVKTVDNKNMGPTVVDRMALHCDRYRYTSVRHQWKITGQVVKGEAIKKYDCKYCKYSQT